ncbi:MAG: phosphoribosyltransferase [Gammaproteobacteria bacterium]|nr:phosphoribosyltransferase [Gammaproteobacteria bacterium]
MKPPSDPVNLDAWRNPVGVTVPDDELDFLLVPDRVEAAVCLELARQVHGYQCRMQGKQGEINSALMVAMGGLLPGILLYDYLVGGRHERTSKIRFGTVRVANYTGPGERHGQPQVLDEVSMPVQGQTVLIIDDLGDSGDTLRFLSEHVLDKGAEKTLILTLYMKPDAMQAWAVDFFFGEISQNTWIITPRERVETLMKRVPVWKQRGASEQECRRRLCDLIGYSAQEVDYYLPIAYAKG